MEERSYKRKNLEHLYPDLIEQQELIFRIEAHILTFIKYLNQKKLYELKVKTSKRFSNTSRQLNFNVLPAATSNITVKKLQKLAYKLIILAEVYNWQIQNKSSKIVSNVLNPPITLRQMYYMTSPTGNTLTNSQRPIDQRTSNEEILEIGNLLRASRSDMGISEASKGQFFYTGCDSSFPVNITQETLKNFEIGSLKQMSPRSIIVVEKEGIFLMLWKHKFTKLIPSIVVCAKGFPDINTRHFVQMLSTELSIPIMGLIDYNPSGVNILLNYTYGSYLTGMSSNRTPLHGSYWLGLFNEQIERFGILTQHKQLLSIYDRRFLKNLKNDFFVVDNEQFQKEIQLMESNNFKIELQNIFTQSNIQEVFHYFAKLILTKRMISIARDDNQGASILGDV